MAIIFYISVYFSTARGLKPLLTDAVNHVFKHSALELLSGMFPLAKDECDLLGSSFCT